MNKAIKLNTNGSMEIVDVPEQNFLEWCHRQIDTDLIENIYPRGLSKPYMLVADEEALLKDQPVINFLASWLYETQNHGHPICGTVLVMQQVINEHGFDTDGIPADKAMELAVSIANMLPTAVRAIKEKLGNQIKF